MNEHETASAEAALKALGLTAAEVRAVDKELREQAQRRGIQPDRRICICGHAVARHTDTGVGIVDCKPNRMQCPCKKCRPVLIADDIRKFIRKTNGGGPLHALTLGILSHIESEKNIEWIVDIKCDRCGNNDGEIVPVPVTQAGYAKTYATGYDALLCRSCRTEV